MALLAELCDFRDKECVEMFRKGAQLIGKLCCSGNGLPQADVKHFQEGAVHKGKKRRNERVRCWACDVHARMPLALQVLRKAGHESKYADKLWETSLKEVSLGRMSGPYAEHELDPSVVCIASRCGVPQGTRLLVRFVARRALLRV